jgi:hypothetical protein
VDKVTINRTNIGSQLKGNKMRRKKPVQKASMGKFLETFSPAYSIMKGKGPISEGLSKVGGMGLAGAAGALAKQQRDKNAAPNPMSATPADPMTANNATPMTPLKSGGMVKKRRDGCAIKGKTKGTMR